MERFQSKNLQTTFHHHFQARNANISPIFHFDQINNGQICHILSVKPETTQVYIQVKNMYLIRSLLSAQSSSDWTQTNFGSLNWSLECLLASRSVGFCHMRRRANCFPTVQLSSRQKSLFLTKIISGDRRAVN